MADARQSYFELSADDQRDLLNGMAAHLGKAAAVLEKDVWLCRVLAALFSLPEATDKPMAFKGGTSLSKVYGAIERFSEDIDITVDFQHLDQAMAMEVGTRKLTNKERDSLSLALSASLHKHIADVLVPGLARELEPLGATLKIDHENPEKVWVHYPSAAEDGPGYLRPGVLLEFGGRNATDPSEESEVRPDMTNFVPTVEFPVARVKTLSPARTYWEKATLIHVACHRDTMRANPDRDSRHWYDLAMLGKHDIGKRALEQVPLLFEVLKIKRVFFNSGYANYDQCELGNFTLVPKDEMLAGLKADYAKMVSSGMLNDSAPSFDELLRDVADLQDKINSTIRAFLQQSASPSSGSV